MNILLAFNSGYYMGAIVLLQSILDHNQWCDQIHVYVMYTSLTEKEMTRFSEVAGQNGNASVHYIIVDDTVFADAPIHLKWTTKETYYRLLAQKVLPEEVDRILYLDCDMIVMQSLQEFYSTDFAGKLLVACNRRKQGEIAAKTLEQLSLPPDTIYFNAGVLLYNLKEQREQIDPEIYFEYPALFGKWLTYQDQDILNAVFYGQTKYADYRRYNVFDCGVTNARLRERTLKRCVIFHYNGYGKPWSEMYWGRMADIFWHYAQKLPEYQGKYEELAVKQAEYKKKRAVEKARNTRKKHKEEREQKEKQREEKENS